MWEMYFNLWGLISTHAATMNSFKAPTSVTGIETFETFCCDNSFNLENRKMKKHLSVC